MYSLFMYFSGIFEYEGGSNAYCVFILHIEWFIYIYFFFPNRRSTVPSIMRSALKIKFVAILHSSGLGMVKR